MRLSLTALFVTMSLLAIGCDYFPEANFDLARESRLPKWFKLPQGMERGDVTVTMDTYIVPIEKSVFKLRDNDGRTLSTITASRLGRYLYPKELKNPPSGFPKGYPAYEILVADGVVDIVEHRRMQPIFYMTDDPAVWQELGPKE